MKTMEERTIRWSALFAGQLSERVGMGRAFLEGSAETRRLLKRTEEVCGRPLLGPMLDGPLEELSRDEVAQPAVFALGCATWNEIRAAGVPPPDAIAGYSLGNYAAMVAAGAVDFDDALVVILRVLELVRELRVEGAMAAVVGMPEAAVAALCREVSAAGGSVEPANLNAENQVVVAGDSDAVDRFVERASPRALKAVRLPMALPIHSRLMSPVAKVLRAELPGRIAVRSPEVPFYSAVFGRRLAGAGEVLDVLVSQVERPSRWAETVRSLVADGHTNFAEIGSGPVLTRMLRWIDRSASAFPVEGPDDIARLAAGGAAA